MKVDVTEEQIDAIGGVVYAQIFRVRAVRQLRMSLLVPRTRSPKPAVVYFPGGGFITADYERRVELRMALARRGFVVASAEYRTVPDRYPCLVEDGKSAVRYLREHAADLGIDPERIGVMGDSAGGYLVQMLGTTNGDRRFDRGQYLDKSSDVQAVASLYGISNLLNIGEGFAENLQEPHRSPASNEALLLYGPAYKTSSGASIFSDPDRALEASPMGHVKGKKPPFLLMHGSRDSLVSPVQSEQFCQALKQGGNEVEYEVLEGADHGDPSWYQQPVVDRLVDWFAQALGEPAGNAK